MCVCVRSQKEKRAITFSSELSHHEALDLKLIRIEDSKGSGRFKVCGAGGEGLKVSHSNNSLSRRLHKLTNLSNNSKAYITAFAII